MRKGEGRSKQESEDQKQIFTVEQRVRSKQWASRKPVCGADSPHPLKVWELGNNLVKELVGDICSPWWPTRYPISQNPGGGRCA